MYAINLVAHVNQEGTSSSRSSERDCMFIREVDKVVKGTASAGYWFKGSDV